MKIKLLDILPQDYFLHRELKMGSNLPPLINPETVFLLSPGRGFKPFGVLSGLGRTITYRKIARFLYPEN